MKTTYSSTLSAEEYNSLRISVGWPEIENNLTINGLQNSAFTVCARDHEKAIGMARVITDFGYIVFIADVIVVPAYQGNGIGGEIMQKVMDYIHENIASDKVNISG